MVQAQREMERRIVAQLLTCLDNLTIAYQQQKPVIVLAATNRADALDDALRRTGRFDREICLNAPDMNCRARILKVNIFLFSCFHAFFWQAKNILVYIAQVMCARLRVAGDLDFLSLAKRTGGYVGADIQALTKEAATIAIRRIFHQLQDTSNGASSSSAQGINGGTSSGKTAQLSICCLHTPFPSFRLNVFSLSSIWSVAVSFSPTLSGLDVRERIADALRDRVMPLSAAELSGINITARDFEAALKNVQPSATREGWVE
jgi:ribosome biogenesis ATPase